MHSICLLVWLKRSGVSGGGGGGGVKSVSYLHTQRCYEPRPPWSRLSLRARDRARRPSAPPRPDRFQLHTGHTSPGPRHRRSPPSSSLRGRVGRDARYWCDISKPEIRININGEGGGACGGALKTKNPGPLITWMHLFFCHSQIFERLCRERERTRGPKHQSPQNKGNHRHRGTMSARPSLKCVCLWLPCYSSRLCHFSRVA